MVLPRFGLAVLGGPGMRLLSRYIFVELLRVFLFTLMGMTVVLLLAGVAQEAIREGLGIWPILRLIPYLLPDALVYAVPGTILFAVCSVYGRMAADNELTAAKSLGISPAAFLVPGLILAFLVSLGAVWLNDVAASWGQRGARAVVFQSVEQIVYGMLRTRGSYSTNQFSVHVDRVDGRKLIHPTVTFHPPGAGNRPPITLTAEDAVLRLDAKRGVLVIEFNDGEVDSGGEWMGDFPGLERYEIPLSAASRKGEATNSGSHCAMREVSRLAAEQEAEMLRLKQESASQVACELITGDFAALTGPQWSDRHRRLRDAQTQLFKLRLVPWRRWANGFSCLFFAMVGAPLAIRLRNADIWTSFGLCFLPILLVYYPLLMYGLDRAKCGVLPPYAVWFGNLMLMVVGSWFVYRVMRR